MELEFDLVTNVMSSIKDEKHKKKITLTYPKNMIGEFNDAQIVNGNKKDGFIKVNHFELNESKGNLINKYNKLLPKQEV